MLELKNVCKTFHAGTPDEIFYSNQAYVLFVIQVAVDFALREGLAAVDLFKIEDFRLRI